MTALDPTMVERVARAIWATPDHLAYKVEHFMLAAANALEASGLPAALAAMEERAKRAEATLREVGPCGWSQMLASAEAERDATAATAARLSEHLIEWKARALAAERLVAGLCSRANSVATDLINGGDLHANVDALLSDEAVTAWIARADIEEPGRVYRLGGGDDESTRVHAARRAYAEEHDGKPPVWMEGGY